jgi:hypothetical protein
MIELGLFTLIKVLVSILIVVLLSLIAERAGPRVAGIASGFPLGAAISLAFIALENGSAFAAAGALYTAAGLAATVAFVTGYLAGIRLADGLTRWLGLAASIGLGLVGYMLAAIVLSFIPVNRFSAPAVAVAVIGLAGWRFRRIPDVQIRERIRLGYKVAFVRAGFAAAVILVITTLAEAIGPRWAGIFSAFPITMLPLMAIIQATYRPEHVRAIIKNVPRGLGSLVVYAMVIYAAYPLAGIGLGTLMGYLAATAYLIVMEFGRIKKCL